MYSEPCFHSMRPFCARTNANKPWGGYFTCASTLLTHWYSLDLRPLGRHNNVKEEKQAYVRATNGRDIQEMDDEEDSWSKSITALAHKRQHQNLSTSVPVQRQQLHRQKPTPHLSSGSILRRFVQRGQWRWQRAVMFAHTEFCNWFFSLEMHVSAAIMLFCREVHIY